MARRPAQREEIPPDLPLQKGGDNVGAEVERRTGAVGCPALRSKKVLSGLFDMTRIVTDSIGGFTCDEDSGGVGA